MEIENTTSFSSGNSPRDFSFGIIGAGRVGVSLGVLLERAGYRVTAYYARSSESRARAEQWLSGRLVTKPDEVAGLADSLLLSLPDASIEPVTEQLVEAGVIGSSKTLVHSAGALGLEPLRKAAASGASTLAIHPLQSVPGVQEGIVRIPGSWFGITCLPEMESWAKAFVEDLGGIPLFIDEENRVLYHAAAVVASNYLVMLAGLTGRIGGNFDPYLPLMRGALQNVEDMGSANALTGPVVRGDVETIRDHLLALSKHDTDLVEAYAALAKATARFAVSTGRLNEIDADRILHLLEEHA